MSSNSVKFELSLSREQILSGSQIISAEKRLSGLPLVLCVSYNERSDNFQIWCSHPSALHCALLYDGIFHGSLLFQDVDGRALVAVTEDRRSAVYPLTSAFKFANWTHLSKFNITATLSVTRLTIADLRVVRPVTVKLQIDGGKTFFVPSYKLSAHSPYFEALLRKPMECYKLHNAEPFAFHLILLILYGYHVSCTEFKQECWEKTLILADRFQIDFVFKHFEEFLLSLEAEQCQRWLQIADKYHMNRATRKIVSTMSKAEILESREALKDADRRFSAETLDQLVDRMAQL